MIVNISFIINIYKSSKHLRYRALALSTVLAPAVGVARYYSGLLKMMEIILKSQTISIAFSYHGHNKEK